MHFPLALVFTARSFFFCGSALEKKGRGVSQGFCYKIGFKGLFFYVILLCFFSIFFLSKIISHAMFRLWVIWWIKFYLMSFGFRGFFFFFLFFPCFILTKMFKAYDFFWNICDDLLSLFVITVMLIYVLIK
jgi:hypothetical protein